VGKRYDLTEPHLTHKLARFAEVGEFSNCVQIPDAYKIDQFDLQGNWAQNHFKNNNPITLELACGKGEYTVGQAAFYPDRNFIGIDIKGNRIWKGAKKALAENLENAAFLRTRIDHISKLFGKDEVSEIWIVFPDPQLKKDRKKLTSSLFIEHYRSILKPNGIIQLKTDNFPLFQYTQEIIAELGLEALCQSTDVYVDLEKGENDFLCKREKELRICTFYEERWLSEGKKINYIAFRLG